MLHIIIQKAWEMSPINYFLILMLETLSPCLVWQLISFLISQLSSKTQIEHKKKFPVFQFTGKPSIARILERYLFVAQEVLYKSSMILHP